MRGKYFFVLGLIFLAVVVSAVSTKTRETCNSVFECSDVPLADRNECATYSETECNLDPCGFASKELDCNPLTEICTCEWDGICKLDKAPIPSPDTCETVSGWTCESFSNCNKWESESNTDCSSGYCCSDVIPASQTGCVLAGDKCTSSNECAVITSGQCNFGKICCETLKTEIENCMDTNTCSNGLDCEEDIDCISNYCSLENICETEYIVGESSDGSCLYTDETPETDTCEDGYISYHWTGVWNWSDNEFATEIECNSFSAVCYNTSLTSWHIYNDVIAEAFTECSKGTEQLPCPAQVQLPFFSWFNLIIAIILIILIYSFFGMNRKSKKKIVKKKRK